MSPARGSTQLLSAELLMHFLISVVALITARLPLMEGKTLNLSLLKLWESAGVYLFTLVCAAGDLGRHRA